MVYAMISIGVLEYLGWAHLILFMISFVESLIV